MNRMHYKEDCLRECSGLFGHRKAEYEDACRRLGARITLDEVVDSLGPIDHLVDEFVFSMNCAFEEGTTISRIVLGFDVELTPSYVNIYWDNILVKEFRGPKAAKAYKDIAAKVKEACDKYEPPF
jgi:hypothetical protein